MSVQSTEETRSLYLVSAECHLPPLCPPNWPLIQWLKHRSTYNFMLCFHVCPPRHILFLFVPRMVHHLLLILLPSSQRSDLFHLLTVVLLTESSIVIETYFPILLIFSMSSSSHGLNLPIGDTKSSLPGCSLRWHQTVWHTVICLLSSWWGKSRPLDLPEKQDRAKYSSVPVCPCP